MSRVGPLPPPFLSPKERNKRFGKGKKVEVEDGYDNRYRGFLPSWWNSNV